MSVNLSGNWWKILTRGLLASQNVPTEEIIKLSCTKIYNYIGFINDKIN